MLEESARIALSWIRAHSAELGLPTGADAASIDEAQHVHTSGAATDPSCWDVHGMGALPKARKPGMHRMATPIDGGDVAACTA